MKVLDRELLVEFKSDWLCITYGSIICEPAITKATEFSLLRYPTFCHLRIKLNLPDYQLSISLFSSEITNRGRGIILANAPPSVLRVPERTFRPTWIARNRITEKQSPYLFEEPLSLIFPAQVEHSYRSIMARGHQKEQARQKNAKRQSAAAKSKGKPESMIAARPKQLSSNYYIFIRY